MNERGGRKPILREPDAAGAQGRLDSLVLNRVETVLREQRFERVATRVAFLTLWQKPVEKVLHAACAARLAMT